jgi:hypothetical protein
MVPLSKVKLSTGKASSCSAQAKSSIVKHGLSNVKLDRTTHRQGKAMHCIVMVW